MIIITTLFTVVVMAIARVYPAHLMNAEQDKVAAELCTMLNDVGHKSARYIHGHFGGTYVSSKN